MPYLPRRGGPAVCTVEGMTALLLVARLHVDLQRVASMACPASRD
jgi:hypothetical protein